MPIGNQTESGHSYRSNGRYHDIIGNKKKKKKKKKKNEELESVQLPWSSGLKASRTGTTRTLTWIARICSHTYINTVTTTLCQAPAQLLQIDRYIMFFNAKVMSGRLKRYQYITSTKQQVTLFAQGHRLSACSDQLTVCLPVCLPACLSVRLLRCQRHVCRQFPHCLFVLS